MTLSGDPQYPSPYGYQYGPPVAVPPRPRVSDPLSGWVLLALGVVVIVGSTGTWATIEVGSFTPIDGTDGDGSLTLAFGIAVTVMGLLIGLRAGRLWTSVVALVFAVLAALTALLDVGQVSRSGGPLTDENLTSDEISVSWGLWTVLVGGLLAVAASIVAMVRRR